MVVSYKPARIRMVFFNENWLGNEPDCPRSGGLTLTPNSLRVALGLWAKPALRLLSVPCSLASPTSTTQGVESRIFKYLGQKVATTFCLRA